MSFVKTANAQRTAEQGIKTILAKLKAGKYKNAAYEEADRKMLQIYLGGSYRG